MFHFKDNKVGINTTPFSTLDINGNTKINGTLNINGNIIPNLNEIYDLGSSDFRWKDIYLSGNTIDLGGTRIQKDINGGIKITNDEGDTLDGKFNNLVIDGNIDISGDLIVKGSTTTINTTSLVIDDPIITLGTLNTNEILQNDGYNKGVEFTYFTNEAKKGFFGFDNATNDFIYVKDTSNNLGNIRANIFIGDLSGNANYAINANNASTVTNGVYTIGNQNIGGIKNFTNKLGIGSSVPSKELDISGNINFTGNLFQNSSPYIGSQWTTSSNNIYYDTGNVGIGSIVPSKKLDVIGDINFTGNLFKNNSPYIGSQWTKSSNNIYYNTGNIGIGSSTPSATLDVSGNIIISNGNVGVGSSTPSQKMDVVGNILLSGNLSASNMAMYRNRIINGNMRVDQRNGGLLSSNTGLLTNNTGYGLDRWKNANNSYINVAQQQMVLSDNDVVAIGGGMSHAVSLTTMLNTYNGLVSYYPFDNTTNDIFRNLAPTVTGTITYSSGKIGNAAFFNNSTAASPTNYIITTNPTPQVPLTFSFWINPNTQPQGNTIMSFSNGTFTGSNLNMNLDITTGTVINLYAALPSLWSISALSSGALTVGVWSHICITMSSAWVATMYVNGIAIATQTGTGNFPTAYAGTLAISRMGDGILRGFYGYLDDLRFYNRNLSPQEVYLLYQSSNTNYTPIFRPVSNPVMYFPFDENLTDATGNGNTLTTIGSVSYVTGYVSSQAVYLPNETDVINNTQATNYITSSYNCPTTFTVAFWFCATRLKTTGDTIFSTNNQTTNVTNSISIYIQSNTLYAAFNNTANTGSGIAIFPFIWYHVTLTYNNTSLILYANGNKIGNTLTATYYSSGYILGYSRDLTNLYPFAGYIDDFRIYNSILSASQICELYMSYTPNQYVLFQQPIEGYNIYDLGLGTSASQPMTVSCWLKNNTSYPQTFSFSVNNSNLVAYIPFENSYTDAINITLSQPVRYGNVSFSNSVYKVGSYSVYFNQTPNIAPTQYLSYTIPANMQPQTVAFWFNPSTLSASSGTQFLCHFGSTTNSANDAWNLRIVNNTTLFINLFVTGYSTGSNYFTASISTTLVAGTWYHCAVTFVSGGYLLLYLNGVLVGSSQFSTNVTIPLSNTFNLVNYTQGDTINCLQIGGGGTLGGQSYHGYIDDFRIYNRPLTATQIYQLYINNAYSTTVIDYLLAKSYIYSTPSIAAGTWKKIVFTIPSESVGYWYVDNNTGLLFSLCLGANSVYTATPNTWNSVTDFTSTGVQILNDISTNYMGINGNNILITAVQLERGNLMTPFEFRPYVVELQSCQRYFVRKTNQSNYEYFGYGLNETTASTSSNLQVYIPLSVNMRSVAVYSTVSNVSHFFLNGITLSGTITSNNITFGSLSVGAINVLLSSAASFTAWIQYAFRVQNISIGTAYIDFNAEL